MERRTKLNMIQKRKKKPLKYMLQSKSDTQFVVPAQVKSLGYKIRSLFHRHFDDEMVASPDKLAEADGTVSAMHLNQKQLNLAGSSKKLMASTSQPKYELNHYTDYDYYRMLQTEVDQLRMVLEADFKNQRIVDLENKIRDNKRIIVNTMTENIFMLRFGFDSDQKVSIKIDREELLAKMLQSRLKRIRIVERLIKVSNERKAWLSVWGLHSDLIDYRRLVRLMQDIVILLQEKNLLIEMRGGKNYTKVGEVERKVNWPIKIRSRFGPMDANDYYSRKLRSEIDDHNFLLVFIERDIQTNSLIAKEMKAFISAVFGNDGWIKLVEARWLRNKQSKRFADYDPGVREQVPVYVKSNFYASTKF